MFIDLNNNFLKVIQILVGNQREVITESSLSIVINFINNVFYVYYRAYNLNSFYIITN